MITEEDLAKLGGHTMIMARLLYEIRDEAIHLNATLESIKAENEAQTVVLLELVEVTRQNL